MQGNLILSEGKGLLKPFVFVDLPQAASRVQCLACLTLPEWDHLTFQGQGIQKNIQSPEPAAGKKITELAFDWSTVHWTSLDSHNTTDLWVRKEDPAPGNGRNRTSLQIPVLGAQEVTGLIWEHVLWKGRPLVLDDKQSHGRTEQGSEYLLKLFCSKHHFMHIFTLTLPQDGERTHSHF